MATQGKNLSKYDKSQMPEAKNFRFGLVVAKWNENITEGLFKGAFDTLKENGVINENIVRWNVPGSFELIYGCKKMQQSYEMLDAIIAIGSVIEGETKHFDFVCQGVTQGIKDLNIQNDIPVIFCVLTDQNMQQAIDRSGGKFGNKGSEAAVTAIKMAQLRIDAKF
ncbi:6,7-dimethyl-8-ribityllumazine synthase [Gillisia sp. Hel_I_86]|uniref:6,7-dimethyl-8-ribityllumazine synthase n=1 Tax=Gillisia sp. Hel_I_86 TaxID=1249981 RepID=UPI00119A5A9F|nr:6,7-dimethyl-8-ribityllumazine synthase [Gillisia sp. Hel_I_86]TVZ25156.1 6,7-dimethyl-8-ribityllumazine synthase [Gillisia sp. Hel_I_86]